VNIDIIGLGLCYVTFKVYYPEDFN